MKKDANKILAAVDHAKRYGSGTVPVEASFEGATYGLGTLLAAGWKGWFGTIPIVITWADMDDTTTDGVVTTISPRVGRLFGLGRAGNLGLFAGVQYLKSKLDVSGTFDFGESGAFVEYRIRQRNKDRWTVTVGGNWSFNKYLSWSLECSGFTGSREGVVTSLGLRFWS